MDREVMGEADEISRPNNEVNLPFLLTPQQLAKLRGTSTRTLERERCNGLGVPFVKWGRRVLYRKQDVLKFINEQTFTSTSAAKIALRQKHR
jgi:hypothetical protein